jgi:hypothetical protein
LLLLSPVVWCWCSSPFVLCSSGRTRSIILFERNTAISSGSFRGLPNFSNQMKHAVLNCLYWRIFMKVATNNMDPVSTARTIVCSCYGSFSNNSPAGLWSTEELIGVNWLYHGRRTVVFLVMLIRWVTSDALCVYKKVLHSCTVLFPVLALYWELLAWSFAYHIWCVHFDYWYPLSLNTGTLIDNHT